MNEIDVLGPVDHLVVEFPADKANFSGEIAAELKSLVERGLVRLLDLILLRKADDGSSRGAARRWPARRQWAIPSQAILAAVEAEKQAGEPAKEGV